MTERYQVFRATVDGEQLEMESGSIKDALNWAKGIRDNGSIAHIYDADDPLDGPAVILFPAEERLKGEGQ